MGVEFGPGTLYFLGNEGGYIPIGETTDMRFDMENPVTIGEDDVLEYVDEGPLVTDIINHLTASLEVTARISFESIMTLLGLRKVILDLCPDKQVVHLTNHATKAKVRKKNFRRAIKILEASE